jgi:hypothetical protein
MDDVDSGARAQEQGHVVDIQSYRTGAPPGALTWDTPAQRSRRLKDWQRGVLAKFDERQVRAIKLCWVLQNLFSVKAGFCFATNAALAEMTMMAENKVQATLKDLEDARAIVRGWVTHPNGRKQRVIYPATGILIRQRGTPVVGVCMDPQQPGVHTLIRRARLPKSELQRAQLAARIRENRESGATDRHEGESDRDPDHTG